MERITLDIEKRSAAGKKAAVLCRNEGKLPAVVYAHGRYSIPAVIKRKEFVNAAQRARTSSVFVLKSEDKELNGKKAFVKEIQRDSIKGTVLHVDFLAVDDGERARVRVPLEFIGEPDGVKNQGGVLSATTHHIIVEGTPDVIPEVLHVDVSALQMNDRIRARDLALPQGAKLYGDPEQSVVGVVAPRAVKLEETPAEAAAEGVAEGEAAPAAEGEEGEKKAEKKAEKKGE